MLIQNLPWNKKVLNRLILSFIAILLPLFVLGMAIYNWGIDTLKTEISRSMSAQVSQNFGSLEQDIRRIQLLQYDCLTDDNLNALGSIPEAMGNIERMESILQLQQRLNAIRNSSPYIVDVYAYIPAIQRKVSALTVSAFDEGEYVSLQAAPEGKGSQLRDIGGRLYMSAAYPTVSPGSARKPQFMLTVEFSKGKLQDNLGGLVHTAEERLALTHPDYAISAGRDIGPDPELAAFLAGREEELRVTTVERESGNYLAAYAYSPFFNAVMSKYVPVSSVFAPLEKFKSWFLLLAALSGLIIVMYSLYAYKYIHKPLLHLVKAFRKVEHEDFTVRIRHGAEDEFRYIYARFNSMLDHVQELVDQVYKQQILTHRAELKQLQSQINPHFLYNSFFISNTMLRLGDYGNLERFMDQLGAYFQFITRNMAEEVTLADEVKHAAIYSEIQATRFRGRIAVEFGEVPVDVRSLPVPRLILQPVIENAFKYALERKSADGILRVSFRQGGGILRIAVEDNGSELSDETIAALNRSLSMTGIETTGIINIHMRIRLKFGEDSGLELTRSPYGGLKAEIHIVTEEKGE